MSVIILGTVSLQVIYILSSFITSIFYVFDTAYLGTAPLTYLTRNSCLLQ